MYLYKLLKMFHFLSDKKYKKIEQEFQCKIIENSSFFDVAYYLSKNPDVKKSGMNPALHYLMFGWKENRDCMPKFDGNEYLRKHPDALRKDINPLVHYELNKRKEKPSIKNEVKNLLDYNDMSYMKSEIDRHEIISFDIFDTLLLRPYIRPTDLFEHLSRLEHVNNFKEIRIAAEQNARRKHHEKEDITLADIYDQMPIELKTLKDKEINLEKKLLKANFEMQDIFQYAKKKGKRVIAVSDMYLPGSVLQNILNKNGFTGFENIYVSSDLGRGKGKTLFNYILNELKEPANKFLHIGDNRNSDYKKPKSLGMSAIFYNKVADIFLSKNAKAQNFWVKHQSFEASVLLMSLALFNHENREIVYWKRFGFEYGGPIIYWYLKWIEKQIAKKRVNDIIFVARDGYTLKKMFDQFGHKNIRLHYVYASRQLFINSFLDDAIADNRTLALIQAFSDIDADICRDSVVLRSEDSSREYVRNNYEKFEKLCKRHFEEYKKYIKKQRVVGQKIAIVDTITGAASSVKLLRAVLPNNTMTSFFWIGLASVEKMRKKFGIKTFSLYQNHNHIASWDLIEYVMTAPEPPVKSIRCGRVVYDSNIAEEEKERIERYKIISQSSLAFSTYMQPFFGKVLDIKEDLIVDWINTLFDTGSGYDRKYLGSITVCADSSHSLRRPLYKGWVPQLTVKRTQTNISLESHFNDLKCFINRIVEKKLSTMAMHQRTFIPFKNKHCGRDIVIVATGPTLKYFKPIENAVYIGVNRAFMAENIKLDYLFLQDFSGATAGYIQQANKLSCVKFYGLTSENDFPERTVPEDVRLEANAYPYRTDWEVLPNFKTEFAYDLSVQSLGCGGTVVFPALQFALWTHPRRIYLVGVDTTCQGYFNDAGKNFLKPQRLIPLYKRFKDFAKQYYPYTEIISVNPVGLKGIFEDTYTDGFPKKSV